MLEPLELASIGAAIVSALAFMVALSSRGLASRSLRIAENQERRRQPALAVELREATSHLGQGNRIIGFNVLVVNASDGDGALASAEMHVTYDAGSRTPVTVKLPHDPRIATPDASTALSLPQRLAGRDAVAGWLMFAYDYSIVPRGRAEKFEAVLRDARGIEVTVDAWVFREV